MNASGQFVGLAEMVGCVDFSKTVEHWQQDKWTGCFPVKWHIVKDVPNSLLKHIILENNENKPLTNSRDTHEVRTKASHFFYPSPSFLGPQMVEQSTLALHEKWCMHTVFYLATMQ